jgi:dephospho-CoA kinase
MRRKVIAISGMPGAGKAIVSQVGKELGLDVFVLGDVIREETKRRGLEPTPQNMGSVMLSVRESEGPAAVARRLLPRIEGAHSSTVIVEGIRSMHELNELKSKCEVISVAVHASARTRFGRLGSRNRSDDSKDWAIFQERDLRELKVGLGGVLALADVVLVNEGTVSELQSAFRRELSKLGLQ